MKKRLFLCLSLLFPLAQAETVYQSNDAFISASLGTLPKAQVLWLNDTQKADIESILAHRFNKLRLRYWRDDGQTVWIMDEIGKESPITVGIHVSDGKIIKTQVLVYRESRGDEVRHDFFTDQFKSATLTPSLELDRSIDGITGATLSVKALTKLSRIALYLDAAVQTQP
ncbi:FMN-binding protein [Shewanella khirikhana]|uniref:FMN-binding domain protein n=1 Tax=Shewanella khirikhana TaxID=1965282 RepID=A0ABM7CYY3_9GAMM|nr:FMN-binding protein [Shewanella khirikhana]AZQ09274.1 FMN-binding domain protein [Shewanella khirikhana]